jgi:hypothetical protein
MNIVELANIRSQIAELAAMEKCIVEEIKAAGIGTYVEGTYAATVYTVAERSSPDAKAMEAKLRELGVDNRWFAKNQKVTKGYTALKLSVR